MKSSPTEPASTHIEKLWHPVWKLAGADLWHCRWLLLKAYSFSLLGVVALVLLPWPLKLIIDHILGGQPLPALLVSVERFLHDQHWLRTEVDDVILLAVAYVLIAATVTFSGATEKITQARIRERLVLNLRSKILSHFQTLSVLQSHRHRSGDMVLRITGDVYALVRLLSRTVPLIFRYLVVALFTLSVMVWIEPWLAATGLIMVIILALLVIFHAGKLRQASRNKRAREGEVAGFTQEVVKGLATVQALTAEDYTQQRFRDINRSSLRAGLVETRAAVRMEFNMQMINGIAVALIMGAGALFVIQGSLTVGDLTVFVAYMIQLLKPVEKINELASTVSRGLSRAELLVALLNQTSAVQDRPQARPLIRTRGGIEFRSVSFAYPAAEEKQRVLQAVNFSLKAGQLTVLTGPSGSGKSTLMNLLLRQLNPTSGSILIDGKDYQTIALSTLRRQFAVMLQHPHLFAGTLREALWLNQRRIDDFRIWVALVKVDMEEWVRQLPDGLDTRLSEDGLNISGGQRARLSLARALLLDRPILLLDEPLANIDAHSQSIILLALDQVRKDKTCLVISHQPRLIDHADQLLRLEQGRMHPSSTAKRFRPAHSSNPTTL